MPFLTNSDADIRQMLADIGVSQFEDLISNIPQNLRYNESLKIPGSLSELEVTNLLYDLARKNKTAISFLGGGVYDHYVPAIIHSLISRSEFYTAYTPYQPEVSQGTLQSIYEFQSMICELTGMDVTNASMYEGGSALAEAMLLANNHTRKNKILVAGTLNPRYKQVLQTYICHKAIEIVELPVDGFQTDVNTLASELTEAYAAVIIQHPNYFGFLEDMPAISQLVKERNALLIVHYDPVSLGILAPPGEYQADIAVAEGQVLGNFQNYGGPFLGLFSSKIDLVRKIPGRVAGLTHDVDGKQGFVLTLQTREQHIRREKATSNICTNSGLLALAATIYLAALGKAGIVDVANLCLQKAHYLADRLQKMAGVELAAPQPFFKEFTVKLPVPAEKVLTACAEKGIFAGIELSKLGFENHLLIAVTEKRTKAELDLFITCLKEIL
ncbi:MAG: aminomethyl-transferring glycine dehydrogenase subunit GcvPA [Calditrichales bacterium]|nr:MAG: aminomethyl-transferring glycine dehydrogenase subunit GcvPA [Calditrichales bacterium]